MTAPALGFIHRFTPATRPGLPPLLLLHGTGGNEDDLLPLGERLLAGAARLSPRGQVLIDAQTRDIVQDVYIRKVEKQNGQLYNVEFDVQKAVKDPGKAK